MAIDASEFLNKVEPGLRANKDYTRFFYRFKHDGKTKRGILDYTAKSWDKRTRLAKAKSELLKLKSKQTDSSINFTENSSLNIVADLYFSLVRQDSNWTNELKHSYDLYCRNGIGKKKIKDIRKIHIDNLRKSMEEQGHSKQTVNGCGPRSIKKVLIQTVKPILEYALENKVLDDIPTIKVPIEKRQKKNVKDAGLKLKTLHDTIMTLYEQDGFYRALFLFALYGRRWNEIRTLEWSDIDFLNSTYTIRAENNKIGEDQTYNLSDPIRNALYFIEGDRAGLVFKSPVTGEMLYSPKKQLDKIKEAAGIPELTMHLFRHILVSAMGEVGTEATILSASLGHTNLKTVNQFYLSVDHQKSSEEANKKIEQITKQSANQTNKD